MSEVNLDALIEQLQQSTEQQAGTQVSIEALVEQLEKGYTPPAAAAPEANSYFVGPADDTRGIVEKTTDYMTGGRREFEDLSLMPKLNLPLEKAARLTGLLATTSSDDRLMSGVSEIIPGAQFDKDKYNNLIVVAPIYDDAGNPTERRTKFYPNPEGFQLVNAMQVAGVASLANPIVGTLKRLGMGANSLLTAATAGGIEAGLIEGASSELSNDNYQKLDPVLGAGGGALGQKAFQFLSFLKRAYLTRPPAVMDQYGNFTPSILKMINDLGLDPSEVSQTLARNIAKEVDTALEPGAVASVAAAQSLPVPVNLTRGDASGVAGQQLIEDQMLKGGFGENAGRTMQTNRDLQQVQLRGNIDEIQGSLGGPAVTAQGQGGAAAQEVLGNLRASESAVADDLYTAARRTGAAYLDTGPGSISDELAAAVRGTLRDFPADQAPGTHARVADMMAALDESGSVADLLTIRRQLVNTGVKGTPDSAAAGQINQVLDSYLEKAVDDVLMSGDEAAISATMKAIRNYKQFASRWKRPGGILPKLTERVEADGSMRFKLAPEAVTNYLFGSSGSGLASKAALARDMQTLKNNLPKEQFDMLRQEAFLMISRGAQQGVDNTGNTAVSGAMFQKAWNKMRDQNPELLNTLFTKDERRLIGQFASVAARVTGGAKNTSNSATSASNMIGKLGLMLGNSTMLKWASRMPIVNGLRNSMYGSTAAENAFKLPIVRKANPMAIGGGAASASSGEGGDQILEEYRQMVGPRISR